MLKYFSLPLVASVLIIILTSVVLSFRHPRPITNNQQPPSGCYYQRVQCVRAPCDPILVCHTPTPTLVLTPTAFTVSPADSSNWHTFTSTRHTTSFKYPGLLTVVSKNQEIEISHHTPSFKHPDPCSGGSGLSPQLQLTKIEDFFARLRILPKDIPSAMRETYDLHPFESNISKDGKSLDVSSGENINPVVFGSLSGYRFESSHEGCGEYDYFFPLESNLTLWITKKLEASRAYNYTYNDYYDAILALPGLIDYETGNQILSGIVNSLSAGHKPLFFVPTPAPCFTNSDCPGWNDSPAKCVSNYCLWPASKPISPTCRPRPKCLDATGPAHCLMPETPDMCPPGQ